MAEPILGQLGYIQNTYAFKKDGKFSLKQDFKSFCGIGAVTPDCEYFWMVFEGIYSISGNSLVLHTTKGQHVQQRKGESKPIIRDELLQGGNKQTFEFLVDGNTLSLIEKSKNKPMIFIRQP